jgi:hypothetical protein
LIPFFSEFRIIGQRRKRELPDKKEAKMFKRSSLQIRAALKNRWTALSRLSVFCTLLILGCGGVLAQQPASSLDELKLLLGKGDKVTLVDPSGKSTTGRIERIAPDAVEMNISGRVQAFTEKDIRQITQRKQDSVLNGILIGAGVGFGATLPFNLAIADRNEKGLAVAASALWGLIGGGIGAIVDVCVTQKQLIYFRPRSNASLSIRPFYSRFQKQTAGTSLPNSPRYTVVDPCEGIGIAVSVRF